MPETIGFVGLGIMGSGMVKNLATKGHTVRVWSRTESKAAELAKSLKIEHAGTLKDLAASSSILMLCVTNTHDVEQIVNEAASSLKKGCLVVDCSTISPKATEEIAGKLRDQGIGFVDAPVSGGSEGAEHGALAVMAGGTEDDFNRAKPILKAIGTRITHMGPTGKGQVTKLLHQILVVVNMLAVSEAPMFGKGAQLDLKKAVAAVEFGAGGSWTLSKRAPQVLDNYWQPGFTIDLQQKDVDLILEYTGDLGVPLLATGMIRQLHARLQKEGLGNHALIQALEPLMPSASQDKARGGQF